MNSLHRRLVPALALVVAACRARPRPLAQSAGSSGMATFQAGYGGVALHHRPAPDRLDPRRQRQPPDRRRHHPDRRLQLFQRQRRRLLQLSRARVGQRRHDHRRLDRHRQQPERRRSGQPQHRHRQLHARPTPATINAGTALNGTLRLRMSVGSLSPPAAQSPAWPAPPRRC